jgi:hypothetical protein
VQPIIVSGDLSLIGKIVIAAVVIVGLVLFIRDWIRRGRL